MAHRLLLAPAGPGKTAFVLARLRALKRSQGERLPKIWALLATRRQTLSFRQQLIEAEDAASAYFNIEFFNFYSLNARLLKIAGAPVRRLNPQTRFRLLRRLLAQMQAAGELETFQRIADTRGFVKILADFINELKQAKVDVEDFAEAAASAKDQEIARIYRAYQDLLRRSDLADIEGEGWLALAKLQERPHIARDVDMLIVDGYDQFTPVQAQMLAALARAIPEVNITLTDIADERVTALPNRSVHAQMRLREAFTAARQELAIETIAPGPGGRAADLERLSQRIFRDQSAETAGDVIRLIERPSPADEVKRVLREIKRQLLDGIQPDDILVAIRQWERYAAHFQSGRADYDLPLALEYEARLGSAPLIAALMDLLGLAPRFRREDLLDVLRSPYIDADLDGAQIDHLDAISRERQYLGGDAAGWLEIVQLAGAAAQSERGDHDHKRLSPDESEALSARLGAFFDGVTPPARAEAGAYVNWLESLLGLGSSEGAPDREVPAATAAFSLNIDERLQALEADDAEITRRDIAALIGLRRLLRDIAASDEVLRATIGGGSALSWRDFWSDLGMALESTAIEPEARSRVGRVLVATATQARGLPHDHVYIVGLAEGSFPAEVAEDPLYLDSEREAMQARQIPLATRAERIDDRGLFYELISLPRESLTLSRPNYQGGKVWSKSRLWTAVRQVFPHLQPETAAVGAVVPAAEAGNAHEMLLGLAAQLNGGASGPAESALKVRNWLETSPELREQWRRIEEGRGVERGRLSNSPFDRHSGILSRPHLLGEVERRLGADRVWSASQLKDYGLCGFRFFAKRLLKLEETAAPEVGFDDLRLGSLNHHILEATYREIAARGLRIDKSNLGAALAILAATAEDILERAPALFDFRASPTWQEEKQVLRSRLLAFIKQDFSPESPLNFFGDERVVKDLELRFADVSIDLPGDMPPLRVSGFIDRVDLVDGKLVVIDYKSGSTPIQRREMEIGRDFQMWVYALALQGLLERDGSDRKLAGGLFWHLRNLRASGVYAADDEEDADAIEAARGHAAANLERARKGQFPVLATALEAGKCSRYCEFSHLCRRQVTNPYKALPGAASPARE